MCKLTSTGLNGLCKPKFVFGLEARKSNNAFDQEIPAPSKRKTFDVQLRCLTGI